MPHECLICLSYEDIPNDIFVCFFSDKCSCNSFAHKKCISQWRELDNNKNKCPNCRTLGNILEMDVPNQQSKLYLNILPHTSELPISSVPVSVQTEHTVINPLANLSSPVISTPVVNNPEPRNTFNMSLGRILDGVFSVIYYLIVGIGLLIYGIFFIIFTIFQRLFQVISQIRINNDKLKLLIPIMMIMASLVGFIFLLLYFIDESDKPPPTHDDDYKTNDDNNHHSLRF